MFTGEEKRDTPLFRGKSNNRLRIQKNETLTPTYTGGSNVRLKRRKSEPLCVQGRVKDNK